MKNFTGQVKFTDAQRTLILAAVAAWQMPPNFSQLPGLQDEVAIMLAEALGMEQEAALNRMQAFQMTL
jgi:hypothetical protein